MAFRVGLPAGNASAFLANPGLAILLRCALARTEGLGVDVTLLRLRSLTDAATGAVTPLSPGGLVNLWSNCAAAEGAPPPNYALEAAALGVPLLRQLRAPPPAPARGLAAAAGLTVDVEIRVPANPAAADPGGLGAGVIAEQGSAVAALTARLNIAFATGAAASGLGRLFLGAFAGATGVNASALLGSLTFSAPTGAVPAPRSPTPSPLPPPALAAVFAGDPQSALAVSVAVPLLVVAALGALCALWWRRHARLQREAMATITMGARLPPARAAGGEAPPGGPLPLLGKWAAAPARGGAFGGANYADDPSWAPHLSPRAPKLLAPPTSLAGAGALLPRRPAAPAGGGFVFWGLKPRKGPLRSSPPPSEAFADPDDVQWVQSPVRFGGGGAGGGNAAPAPRTAAALKSTYSVAAAAGRLLRVSHAPSRAPALGVSTPPQPHKEAVGGGAFEEGAWAEAEAARRGGARALGGGSPTPPLPFARNPLLSAKLTPPPLRTPPPAPASSPSPAPAPSPSPAPAATASSPAIPAAHRLRAAALVRNALTLVAAASPPPPPQLASASVPLRPAAARGALSPAGGAGGGSPTAADGNAAFGGGAQVLPGGAT